MNITDITKQIRAFADQLESTQTTPSVDPYADLKEAHAAGKTIQRYHESGQWIDHILPSEQEPIWFHPVKDLRIKPEPPPFQLPPPPPGMQWHRTDGWKAEDLPPGTRPLVEGEKEEWGDEYWSSSGECWRVTPDVGRVVSGMFRLRTTRPLVFEHAGKSWNYHRPGDPMPCDGERMVHTFWVSDEQNDTSEVKDAAKEFDWAEVPELENRIIGWRYAEPTTREVELGPEDVEPLSMIRRKGEGQSWHWRLLSYVHGTHAICADRGYTWSELARDYEINRPRHRDADGNPTLWEKCSKEVPA